MSTDPQTGYPPGHPTPGYPQDGYPPQRPTSGCGGCLGKFLIFLGIVFALMLVLCCGGGLYMRSYFIDSVSQQPAEVQAISDEIISIRVQPPLEPVGGGRFKVPFVGTSMGQGVVYADKGRKCILVLASIGDAFGPQLKEQLIQSLESGQSQKQSGNQDDHNEEIKDAKTTDLGPTIHAEKATFKITEGVGAKTGKKKIRVNGKFQGKTGPAVFLLNAEAETLSLEDVKKMIESME
jgi:hypothetical protein